MRKLLTWILLPPAAVIVIGFAIANRAPVRVSLDPLPFAFHVPLYVIAMAAAFLGLLLGGVAAWNAGTSARRRARALRREVDRVEGERERTTALLAKPPDADAA